MDNEQIRVSGADRDRALAALRTHFEAGRLDSFEYEDRRGRAGDAQVRADLDVLFAGLPSADAVPVGTRSGQHGSQRCFSHGTAYSLVPLLATALFFFTHTWVWFLLIPAAGYLANAVSRPGAAPQTSVVRS